MRSFWRIILAIVMSVVLAVGLCPGAAVAENESSGESISGDLVAAVSNELVNSDFLLRSSNTDQDSYYPLLEDNGYGETPILDNLVNVTSYCNKLVEPFNVTMGHCVSIGGPDYPDVYIGYECAEGTVYRLSKINYDGTIESSEMCAGVSFGASPWHDSVIWRIEVLCGRVTVDNITAWSPPSVSLGTCDTIPYPLTISQDELAMERGEQYELGATCSLSQITGEDESTYPLQWTVEDTAIAEFDAETPGLIVAKEPGSTIATVSVLGGYYSRQCEITVSGQNGSTQIGKSYSGSPDLSFQASLRSGADKRATVNAKWDDSWFAVDGVSYTYNHNLGTTASVLACAAYRGDLIVTDYQTLGFDVANSETYLPSGSDYQSNYNQVGYSMAAKEIETSSGRVPLIAISIRGTPGNGEWLSNLNVSNSSKSSPYAEHEGFSLCRDRVMEALKDFVAGYAERGHELNLSKARILVMGHSRGAAVANLVAASLDDGDLSNSTGTVQAGNVYAYTFATPTVSRSKASNAGLYHNIQNIVNPEDIVPKVPLGAWGYYRYGRTLMLPSKSNMWITNYLSLKAQMNTVFRSVSGGLDYKPYRVGAGTADLLALELGWGVPSVEKYYEENIEGWSFWDDVRTVVSYRMLGGSAENLFDEAAGNLIKEHPVVTLMLALTIGSDALVDKLDVSPIGIMTRTLKGSLLPAGDEVSHGHTQETYVSWMKAIDASAFEGRTYLGVIIGCPVDVKVYDSANNLVCSIEDEAVDEEIMQNGLAAWVDGEEKHVTLPNDSEYRIDTTARENGQMDFIVEEYNDNEAQVESVKAYLAVPLTAGQGFTCESAEGLAAEEHVLLAGDVEAEAQSVVSGEDIERVQVSVSADGDGDIWGATEAIVGQEVNVHAMPVEGSRFVGWFLEGQIVSDDADYSFRPTGAVSLTAQFEQIQQPAIDLSGAVVSLAQTNHTYDGKAKTPGVTVKLNSDTVPSSSYDVSYKNNVNAGTATVTVTGKGNYAGGKSATFKINPASIATASLTLSQSSYTYDGKAKTPGVTVKMNGKTLKGGTDYTVSYKNNVRAGTATATVTAKGNYTGSKSATFKITAASTPTTPGTPTTPTTPGAPTTPTTPTTPAWPLYRLFQPKTGEHHYTLSAEERDICTDRWGWVYEGVSWDCPEESSTPVYRLFHPTIGLHHYTTSAEERDICTDRWGWTYEGVAWYADDGEEGRPVYRLFHPVTSHHHYTTSQEEVDICTDRWGWTYEGVAWYARD